VEQQAIDRINRFGQTRNIDVVKFVVVNSIEEKILDMQKKKKDLADGVLGDSGKLDFGNLTYSQFVSLFNGNNDNLQIVDNENVDTNLI
jgi:SNF2 family DNA or RNA helicase